MEWIQNLMQWAWGLVTSLTWWDAFGFVGQVLFGMRFVIQWIATERKRRSVIPISFWYLSLAGSSILLIYAIHIGRLVLILGFSLNMIIYVRNLYHIYRRQRRTGLGGGGDQQAGAAR